MKPDLQMAEPRSATILRHTRQAIMDRQLVVANFAAEVVDRYLATHEMHQRVVKFREPAGDVDAMCDAMKHNAQIVDRYIKQVVKAFPSDLEESWTAALPPTYRLACERELVRRRGFIGARVRASSDTPAGSIADAMKEFSEVVAASASALLDGQFDDTERRAVAGEIDDAIAALVSYRQQLVQGMAIGPGAVVELAAGQKGPRNA